MPAVTPLDWDTTPIDYSESEAGMANLALARIGADLIRDTLEDTASSRQAKAIFAATRDELLRDYEFNFAQKRVKLGLSTFDGKAGWSYAYAMPSGLPVLKVLDVAGNKENLYEYFARTVLANIQSGAAGAAVACDVATPSGVVTPAAMTQFTDGLPVELAGSTAPAGLVLGTTYWVRGVTGTTLNLAAYPGGPALPVSSVGADVTIAPVAYLEVRIIESVLDPAMWDSLFKDAFVLRIASKMAIPLTKRADLAQFLQSEFAAIFTLAKNASSQERQVDESEATWTTRGSR